MRRFRDVHTLPARNELKGEVVLGSEKREREREEKERKKTAACFGLRSGSGTVLENIK